jgi:hypothetical protein
LTRRLLVLPLLAGVLAAAAGCGSSGGGNSEPTIQKALVTQTSGFRPAAPVRAGKPVTVSFRILQPSGDKLVTMTRFKKGSGPHTGVHMIIVRDDLGVIIHRHPPMGLGGLFKQQVTFPSPGPYRVILDVYPATGPLPNFQLTRNRITVAGAYKPQPLPPAATTDTIDGYHFQIRKITPSPLKAVQSSLMTVTVTDPKGKPVVFTPWYGALAHAIFFQKGTLNYFHTHVCSPGAGGCTSIFAGSKVTGSSATPGKMTVGVLLPLPGTWRLFLQLQAGKRILTAPFTLHVGG